MKNKAMMLAMCLLTSGAGCAFAQEPGGKLIIGMESGAAIPLGSASRDFEAGFAVQFHVGWKIAEHATVGIRGGYTQFGVKPEIFRDNPAELAAISSVDGHVKMVDIGPYYQYGLCEKKNLRPWISAGMAYHRSDTKIETTFSQSGANAVTSTIKESDFGINLGVGVDWKATDRLSIGLQALWFNQFEQGEDLRYVVPGLSLNWRI